MNLGPVNVLNGDIIVGHAEASQGADLSPLNGWENGAGFEHAVTATRVTTGGGPRYFLSVEVMTSP